MKATRPKLSRRDKVASNFSELGNFCFPVQIMYRKAGDELWEEQVCWIYIYRVICIMNKGVCMQICARKVANSAVS
jgi:hypothetical protein